MARRAYHSHAFKALLPDQREGFNPETDYGRVQTWCSEREHMSAKERAKPQTEADCPKCAAALGKAMLARYGDRVELRRPEGYDVEGSPWTGRYGRPWKGAHEFWLDGVHRGYIVVDNGWGKPWELRQLNGYADQAERPWGYNVTHGVARVHKAAKLAMACAAVKAVEAGHLPTVEEHKAAREAAKVREAQEALDREEAIERRRVEREAAERERAERLALARDALGVLRARGDLSNVERAGLEALALLAGIT